MLQPTLHLGENGSATGGVKPINKRSEPQKVTSQKPKANSQEKRGEKAAKENKSSKEVLESLYKNTHARVAARRNQQSLTNQLH